MGAAHANHGKTNVMKCPLCDNEMPCRPSMSITYYECAECGLLWFNSGELESLIRERVRLEMPEQPDESDRMPEHCPVCGPGVGLVAMTTFATRSVQVRGCTVCFGHALTRGQARALVQHVCGRGPTGWLRRIFRRAS